ncbi:MAG: zf-HC2 domain-containing protein, partial [Candidatus Limnocylindria bacterium]
EMLGIEEQELRALLAAARKELRQTITHLSGSGWCERAEGLISDRLDGVVLEPDGRRLDVHLRNCPRCVEHERRLVQATDALLAGVVPARPRGALLPTAPLAAVPPRELDDRAPKEGAPGEPAEPSTELAPPSANQIAAAAEVLVTVRTRRQLTAAVTWNAMVAIAVILTVVSIILIVAAALGAPL